MTTPLLVPPASQPAPPAPIAPLARSERSLAPDIARGAMLLLIAIANVGSYRFGYRLDADLTETGQSLLDRVALGIESLLVADRSRPMFAILYGFGIAMMASRLAARGVDAKGVRRVLRRRSLWLVVFGALHVTLLFTGDILGAYGATGLVALLLVHRSDRALRRWFWVALVVSEAVMIVLVLSPLADLYAENAGLVPGGLVPGVEYVDQVLLGAGSLGVVLLVPFLLLFVAPVVLGFGLHRRGWLERPGDHLVVLRRVFWGAVGVNLLANSPYALAEAGVWEPEPWAQLLVWELHSLSGLVMGAGYICGFALLAHRWRHRGRRGVLRLLAAVGERSMTAYLAQSMILAPLLSLWGLGLGGRIGIAQAYLVAIGAWAVILLAMVALDRAGRRGPFEAVLRRLTYGP